MIRAAAKRPAAIRQPGGPRIYYLHPLLAGPLAHWPVELDRIAGLGFDHVLIAPPFRPARHGSLLLSATHHALHPALALNGTAEAGLAAIAAAARAAGLAPMMDVVLERVADGSALSGLPDTPFDQPDTTLDPRRFDPDGDAAHARLDDPAAIARLAAFWRAALGGWVECGLAGFRLTSMQGVPPGLIRALKRQLGTVPLLADMQGVPIARLPDYVGCGIDYVFGSLPWWDGRGDWFWREDAALRRIAPVVAAAETPFAPRLAEHEHDPARRVATLRRGHTMAALIGSGWMMVTGAEYASARRLDAHRDGPDGLVLTRGEAAADLSPFVRALNAARGTAAALGSRWAPRLLTGGGGEVLALARSTQPDARLAGEGALVVINMRLDGQAATLDTSHLLANLGGYCPPGLVPGETLTIPPGEGVVRTLAWRSFEGPPPDGLADAARAAGRTPRIAIEAVTPSVDGGAFPARFCMGERVDVGADLICDGHDRLCAEVRWRAPQDAAGHWRRAAMRPLGNDRWAGAFPLDAQGIHEFTVEAWKDVFGTYRDELSKKVAAGLDVTLEIEEGRLLAARGARFAQAEGEAARAEGPAIAALGAALLTGTDADKVALLLSDETAALMARADGRAFATWAEPAFAVEAERTAARFASWYEVFPRSMSGSADRHGTFDDVIAQLPRIAGMGFDVLYFPPVHPIGVKNRKGRNNSLTAGPDDPGSPYGIADHMRVHPELGTLDDFRRLREAALAHGLELALDFAVQCAPDHAWLGGHPGWFDWRPDGSIRYAENPPKKYQDIVNVDFYAPDAVPGLWTALCEVVLFWCDQGVRIFRVDNPHTKPLPFWQWLIRTVRARFPDTLFLAEAFTKPKMMNRLAKIGFSQSYTYFTWRHTKAEFVDYLTELTTTEAARFFRPNFFVNTPDINPVFLQQEGRPGHLIRAALAATLGGLWGVYSGFELCEATPLPGREEYLDSEKYELRAWDWGRPGNIEAEITKLNWMRRLNPALQTHLGLTFLNCTNDSVLYFEKATADRQNVVLVAINLDPRAVQEAWHEAPLWRWRLPDDAALEVDDLVFDAGYRWQGKMQHVRLDPATNPYAVWRVRPV